MPAVRLKPEEPGPNMLDEQKIREQICEIGRRVYHRGFAAANDGNISCRIHEELLLCTPTGICKGFMKPTDLCKVDLDGRQHCGDRKHTSELQLHLEIYRNDPNVQAVVHSHPPHATAFGIAHVDIPTGILPEVEIFLGVVPRAEYETPGSAAFANTIKQFIGKANTVVLSNHGTVSWGPTLEQAYWNTEILDSYCRILILARQIGQVQHLPEPKLRELADLKLKFNAAANGDADDSK